MNNALRGRIAVSIREADSHSCMYGEGIDAGYLADAVMEVLGGERGVTGVGQNVDGEVQPLMARVFGVAAPSCESGRHFQHLGDTCEEAADWFATGWYEEVARYVAPPFGCGFTVIRDVPAALRGPDWVRPPEDLAPLRKLAEQAMADADRASATSLLHGLAEQRKSNAAYAQWVVCASFESLLVTLDKASSDSEREPTP